VNNRVYLESVSSRIGASIMEFCSSMVGREFHADDLRKHVSAAVGACAPASADRVLRDLRRKGGIDYVCIDRHASLYKVQDVNPAFDLI
jgi:hypothetical protein